MRTYSENVLVVSAFDPAALTNATAAGVLIDTQAGGGPFRNAAIVVNFNTGSATTANFTLAEGDTTSPVTAITAATLGSAQAASLKGVYIINIDLAKRKRYLKLSVVGTGTAGAASAEAHLFNGEYQAPLSAAQGTVITI